MSDNRAKSEAQHDSKSPMPPQNHHLVSKGYQKNFADEQRRLTILDARNGKVVERLRPAKRNWVEDDWNTFWDESGDPNHYLEQEFARIEAGTLRRIRDVRAGVLSASEAGAIINLAAMHLVRSRAFVDFRSHIHEFATPDLVEDFATDPELFTRFEVDKGREPVEGELHAMVARAAEDLAANRESQIESVIDQYNKISEVLTRNTIQLLTLADHLPGLPIGDNPIVHADLDAGRFGFRDKLAVGDSNIVFIPLTRRTAALLARDKTPDTTITTMHQWRRIVDIQIRACTSEIATYPTDTITIARLCRQPLKRPMRRTPVGIVI